MALVALDDDNIFFPPVDIAEEDGLLAIGGSLTTERLLAAYKKGIFPWYDGKIPLWWCPNPRFVLHPHNLVISKSMQQVIKKQTFTFTTNKAFDKVIHHCKTTKRNAQDGTWITDAVEKAYIELHHLGYCISAEAWQNEVLVGGLYGIIMGKVFFGESMFSHVSNASKFAFISLVQQLQKSHQLQLIDCQIYSPHLESLGATMMERAIFVQQLQQLI